jgi:hypothetical protein
VFDDNALQKVAIIIIANSTPYIFFLPNISAKNPKQSCPRKVPTTAEPLINVSSKAETKKPLMIRALEYSFH